jgi:hypothetical protein
MDDPKWSDAEKRAARNAFDAAYESECRVIGAEVVRMLDRQDDVRKI